MIQVSGYAAKQAKAPLSPYSFERREPRDHDVVIDIKFSGICHSDIHQVNNEWGASTYPMVPGHEIAGIVSRVGAKVTRYKVGDRMGVGNFVDSCRRAQDIEPFAINSKESIFDEIIGYDDIKREFVKALLSPSPVGCGKSEFLKQIRNHFEEESIFIDGSYGSKAGIFEKLYQKRAKYVLLDEIDKLSGQDQLAILNLMESGEL